MTTACRAAGTCLASALIVLVVSGTDVAAEATPSPSLLMAATLGDDLVGRTFTLTLDRAETLAATVERTTRPGAGRRVHRGRLVDHPDSWFILAAHDVPGASPVLMGEISIPGVAHYHVREGAAPVRIEPHERLPCEVDPDHGVGRPADAGAPGDDAAGSGTIVDVMVAWTAAARQAVGGAAVIQAQVDSYLAYCDMAYEASGVAHRLRLVQTAETPDVETGNILADLADLRDPDDGFADELHALRDASGADLVCLIVDSPSAGVAYRMQVLSTSFEDSAFSVLGAGVGGLVFAHETGHNMGCAHNNEPGTPAAIFCYSFGHRTPDLVWNTIMSNPPGTHLDLFSSPNLEFAGHPLGVAGDGCPPDAADNVRSLNETASTVAAFRPTVIPLPCTEDLDGSGDVGFSDVLVLIAAWGPCPD